MCSSKAKGPPGKKNKEGDNRTHFWKSADTGCPRPPRVTAVELLSRCPAPARRRRPLQHALPTYCRCYHRLWRSSCPQPSCASSKARSVSLEHVQRAQLSKLRLELQLTTPCSAEPVAAIVAAMHNCMLDEHGLLVLYTWRWLQLHRMYRDLRRRHSMWTVPSNLSPGNHQTLAELPVFSRVAGRFRYPYTWTWMATLWTSNLFAGCSAPCMCTEIAWTSSTSGSKTAES